MSVSVVAVAVDAPPPVDPSARLHDGFYFRAGSGFAAYDERLFSSNSEPEILGRNRGIATVGDFSLGGSIGEHWVLGGCILGTDLLASGYRSRQQAPPAELDPGLRNLALIGPFVIWYPDPRRGTHLDLTLALATLTPRVFGHEATEQSEYLALGAGLAFGAGYDVWVADQWSLGILARTTVVVVSGEDDGGSDWLHVATTSPALLVALTYH